MPDEEILKYAEFLIRKHATDVEFLTVFEMYDQYAGDGAGLWPRSPVEARSSCFAIWQGWPSGLTRPTCKSRKS